MTSEVSISGVQSFAPAGADAERDAAVPGPRDVDSVLEPSPSSFRRTSRLEPPHN